MKREPSTADILTFVTSWIVAVTLSLFKQAASVEVREKFLITPVNY